MPVHDWTRVDAGTFHAFHNSWNTHLMETLNSGVLPPDYYALSEQIASRMQTDVLTLHQPPRADQPAHSTTTGTVAVADAPPAARLRLRPDPDRRPRHSRQRRPRSVVVRHVTDHRVVALIEIVSPANKDRRDHVRDLAGKIVQCLESEIHVLLIDLLPAGRYDPHGIHGAVWAHYDTEPHTVTPDAPLTLAAYIGRPGDPEAFVEPMAVGQALVDMPLFLTSERYVNVPLEATYCLAYRGMPAVWRRVLEAAATPP